MTTSLSNSNVAVAGEISNSQTKVDIKNLQFPNLNEHDIVTLLMYCHLTQKRLVYDKNRHKAIIVNHELDSNIAFVQKIDDKLFVAYKRNTNPMLPDIEEVNRVALENLMYVKYNRFAFRGKRGINELMEVMNSLFSQAKLAI